MLAIWMSFVRTIVPVIVGAVLAWFAGAGITVDPDMQGALTTGLSAGFTALYYLIARLAETYISPKLGWLLGAAKAPVEYGDASATTSGGRHVANATGRHVASPNNNLV